MNGNCKPFMGVFLYMKGLFLLHLIQFKNVDYMILWLAKYFNQFKLFFMKKILFLIFLYYLI